jgi:signal transduction histidine kinase
MSQRQHSHSQRFVFFGFLAVFGGLTVLFLIGVVLVFLLTSGNFPPNVHRPPDEHGNPLACLIPLLFLVLALALGRLGFRRFAKPFAEIMAATDAIAQGNLSVNLPENGPKPMQAMMHSFNNMTAELARADQQRRNLTIDIAHELRNPLHIIQGNLEGMLDGVYEPNPENLIATLDETRLLARLVADLQILSLSEAGQLPLHPCRFHVADLVADMTTSFSARAAEQDVDLQSNSDPDAELFADYDRLDQVLSNLMANALRYTPAKGHIKLRAETVSGQVRITLSDSGTGIPSEDLPFIFDRFWKGDRARTRDGTGSGLGLAIARQLVRAHGGSIAAASQPGQGTTFTVELPLAEIHQNG